MTATVVRSRILRDTYRDSVELMRVAAEVERLPGVARAALLAATPANLRAAQGRRSCRRGRGGGAAQ